MSPVVVLVVGALLLTGCSPGQHKSLNPARANSVAVSAGRSSLLHLPGGLTVSVPKKAVTGTGTLSATLTRAPAPAPRGMRLSGPVYRLQITGTALTGHVQLTLPVPALSGSSAATGPNAALLASYDAPAHRWEPVAARYDPAAHTLTATTPHLSLWAGLRLDASTVLSAAASLLKGFIGIADTTPQPSCPGKDVAGIGLTATSDKGNLVKWCASVNGTQPLLRVADNRHYAMETDYPGNWQVRRLGPSDAIASQIITGVTQFLSPAAGGRTSVIIPGGHTVEFSIPASASGEVQTTPSVEGYLVDALTYGVDTLAMTMDDIPGAPPADPSRTARAVGLAFQSKDCLTQLDAMAHTDVTTAHRAGELFRDDVALAVGCLGSQWQTAYGLTGFIGAFIVKVLLWLVDGIRLVVDGLHGAIDSTIYWRSYRIALGYAAPQRTVYFTQHGNLAASEAPVVKPQCASVEDCVLFAGPKLTALLGMNWTSWTTSYASGTGTLAYSGITPKPGTLPVIVLFDNPMRCAGKYYWSQIDLSFPSGAPQALKSYLQSNSVSAEDQAFALSLENVIGTGNQGTLTPLCASSR